MAKLHVIWTKTADLQFVGVLEYWVNRNKSPTYSKRLVKLVSKITNQISQRPLIYQSTAFKEIRVVSMGHFSMYYKVTDDQIIIVAFWDNRQDPEKLFNALQSIQ